MAMSDVVVVLGMHRSGTSAVAGTLTMLGGATPAHLASADSYNEKGYFESPAFMDFHDELLASAGSYWHDWRQFNPEWYKSQTAVKYRRRAIDLFDAEFNGAVLPVFKDPRICRFVPFWLDVLREKQAAAHIVIPVRSPLDVARSLKRAQKISLNTGLLLWLRHNLDAEAQTRAEARSIFTWKDFNSDWRRVCRKISADTDLPWPRWSDRASYDIDNFLTKELIHHETDQAELRVHSDVHEWTLRAYEALLELASNPFSNSALDTLDQVRALLNQSSQLFGRILVDYEMGLEDLRAQTLAAASARDQVQLHQSELLAENAAALAGLTARAEQAEMALSGAVRDNEALSQNLAAAIGERDESNKIVAELQLQLQETAEKAALLNARAEQAETALGEAARDNEALSQSLAAAIGERDERAAIVAGLQLQLQELAEKAVTAAGRADQAERALGDSVTSRELLARTLAEAKISHAAEIHALQRQLVDPEAALSHIETKQARTSILGRLIPTRLKFYLTGRFITKTGLFDEAWYRTEYPDAGQSGLGAAEHYLKIGFCRGYQPNPFFHTRWYLEHYEDVRRSGLNPLVHYLKHGFREGRDPGPGFQTSFYLETNPDVRKNGMNPLAHYLRYGRHEGRRATRPA